VKPAGAGYYVVCLDHEAGPFRSVEAAERRVSAISELSVCTLEHEIRHYSSYRETRAHAEANVERANEAMGFDFWAKP